MNTKHTPWLLLLSFVCALIAAPTSAAEDEPLQSPALKRFYSELRTLFRTHYPKATSHLLKDTIHFEHDTRVFLVHEPLKTGDWQDPRETRGPKPGGILCDITLQKGEYRGPADIRQAILQGAGDGFLFTEARRSPVRSSLLPWEREHGLFEGVRRSC